MAVKHILPAHNPREGVALCVKKKTFVHHDNREASSFDFTSDVNLEIQPQESSVEDMVDVGNAF